MWYRAVFCSVMAGKTLCHAGAFCINFIWHYVWFKRGATHKFKLG